MSDGVHFLKIIVGYNVSIKLFYKLNGGNVVECESSARASDNNELMI